MSQIEVDASFLVSSINEMDETDMDRLELVTALRKLTGIVSNTARGWLQMYNHESIVELERKELVQLFAFMKKSSLGFMKQGLTFQRLAVDRVQKKIIEGMVV